VIILVIVLAGGTQLSTGGSSDFDALLSRTPASPDHRRLEGPMKVITTIVTKTETFDVHFEIEDEATAQAKLAQMLQDIQKRFCARGDSKKPGVSVTSRPAREAATTTTPAAKS